MQAMVRLQARGMPLRRSNVDTDQIIPSEWLKRVDRAGFGEGLFSEWRADPAFVLNDPRFVGAEVLITGPEFGTGSSREHAVWALADYGFRVVISSRFADIFRGNCAKVGVLAAELPEADVVRLQDAVEADPATLIEIDLPRRRVRCAAAGVDAELPLDDFTRWRFLEGLDDIGLTLRHEDDVVAYERRRASFLPSATALD